MSKRTQFTIVAAFAGIMLAGTVFSAGAQVVAGESPARVSNETDQQTGESTGNAEDAYARSLNELFATSDTIGNQPGGEEPVVFDGEFDNPRWLQGLTVTKSDNPMLEQSCRRQAVEAVSKRAADLMGIDGDEAAAEALVHHMEEHASFIRNNEISHAEYLQSLAECETYCAPLVAELMQCHILSVARKPHGIVLFELNSSRVAPSFEAGVISEIIDQYRQQEDSNILLIGRASQIGDLRYNRRLSGQRALSVRDRLLAAGIPLEDIRPIWFGWEPPQIDNVMANEYGIGDLYAQHGKAQINQSVIMVLF